MENSLEIVFIGSDIDAIYVVSLLKENNIECVSRNALQQSISIGWVDGTPSSSTEVYVNEEDAKKAMKIIENYQTDKNQLADNA